jgi:hypothetical protein
MLYLEIITSLNEPSISTMRAKRIIFCYFENGRRERRIYSMANHTLKNIKIFLILKTITDNRREM